MAFKFLCDFAQLKKCIYCAQELKFLGTIFYFMPDSRSHVMLFYLGEKPYTCGENGCDKAFSTSYSLKSHKGNKHKRLTDQVWPDDFFNR